jgi:hypothetical protein
MRHEVPLDLPPNLVSIHMSRDSTVAFHQRPLAPSGKLIQGSQRGRCFGDPPV